MKGGVVPAGGGPGGYGGGGGMPMGAGMHGNQPKLVRDRTAILPVTQEEENIHVVPDEKTAKTMFA